MEECELTGGIGLRKVGEDRVWTLEKIDMLVGAGDFVVYSAVLKCEGDVRYVKVDYLLDKYEVV